MRVLLLGGGGMLATDLVREKPAHAIVTARTRQELDVRDGETLHREIANSRPDWVLNCAAYTNIDGAETDRQAAFAVNATAVEQLADACRRRGAGLVHFSTDYVFDGSNHAYYSENDRPRPINAYGESKLAGEEALKRSSARHLLIRTQWLYGKHGRSFVGSMAERAKARQPTRVVMDEYGCATYTVDLARATWELMHRGEGTVHVANRGKASRFEVAERIFRHFGAASMVTPCSTREFGSATRRPANSALSVRLAEDLLGREMASWEDALTRYLNEPERDRSTARGH